MFSDLILIHRSRGQKTSLKVQSSAKDLPELVGDTPVSWIEAAADLANSFIFKTCLRELAIVDAEVISRLNLQADDEIYRGTEAFRFLLQTICGLKSPLIGETEVSGQFKIAVTKFVPPATPWGQQLRRFFQNLFEDAKRVRQLHLVDLGSQSYGSVLRRELKSKSPMRVHVLGAGHLVQEILPWIAKDGTEVHIHCRDVSKARETFGNRNDLKIHSLLETVQYNANDAFVIAAPVTAKRISSWLGRQIEANDFVAPKLIADLRADSTEDVIQLGCRVVDLSQVFTHISENLAHLEARKSAALAAIDAAVLERQCHVEYRPFGWEDVCA